MKRLYLISRRDMSPGQQAVQAQHALVEFLRQHPAEADAWYKESNTIAFLEARDEEHLGELYERAAWKGVKASLFREPEPWVEEGYATDVPNTRTALVLAPSGRKLVGALRPALRGKSCCATCATRGEEATREEARAV